MLDIIRYTFAVVFLFLTVYFGIKGFKSVISDPQNKQNHKDRAIYYSVGTLCGLVSFELYYPTIAILICVPILLIGIWMEYLTATSLLSRK